MRVNVITRQKPFAETISSSTSITARLDAPGLSGLLVLRGEDGTVLAIYNPTEVVSVRFEQDAASD